MATSFNVAAIVSDIAVLTNSPPFTASTRITANQVTYWLEQAVRGLSALYRQYHADDRELLQASTLVTVASTKTIALPTNAGEVHAVIWARGVNDYVLLSKANKEGLTERETGGWDAVDPVYQLEGEAIAFYPTPTKAHSVEVFYTTHYATPLSTTVTARIDSDRWLAL